VTDGETIDKSYDTTLYRDNFPAHGMYEKDREVHYHLAKAQSHPGFALSHVLKDRLHHMLYVLCYGLDEDNENNEDDEDGDNPGDIFQHADYVYEIHFPNRELKLLEVLDDYSDDDENTEAKFELPLNILLLDTLKDDFFTLFLHFESLDYSFASVREIATIYRRASILIVEEQRVLS
jgi:hypothetical protein